MALNSVRNSINLVRNSKRDRPKLNDFETENWEMSQKASRPKLPYLLTAHCDGGGEGAIVHP
jgi:hypothetical protein